MGTFRVLIVDDEHDFLETIVKRLKRRKLDATGIDSGIKALELLEKEHFDVVILDVRMPGGMDGLETLKEMKKKRPLLEVIMLDVLLERREVLGDQSFDFLHRQACIVRGVKLEDHARPPPAGLFEANKPAPYRVDANQFVASHLGFAHHDPVREVRPGSLDIGAREVDVGLPADDGHCVLFSDFVDLLQ